MDFNDILQLITPEVHASLRRAVEIGKWADGNPLSREQRELCLQAVIAYEQRHLEARQRTGYIDLGAKAGSSHAPGEEPEVVRIVRDMGGA
ncbi:MAG: DUF1315 family protein [Gammaproteobacteria bacterium]|nr:DUF1315 family protein [Gammaproteobacteria bacterium]